jgi:hypothetical protein
MAFTNSLSKPEHEWGAIGVSNGLLISVSERNATMSVFNAVFLCPLNPSKIRKRSPVYPRRRLCSTVQTATTDKCHFPARRTYNSISAVSRGTATIGFREVPSGAMQMVIDA